jgi:ubiquinone/menaquinone biosynthesis C-methylase UbiE
VNAAAEAGVWDACATRYGSQEHLQRRPLSAALRLASPGPQDVVVDLGTGTGAVLRALARSDSRPAMAVGVDRSAGMLARVGALPSGWSTILADARDVPLPDGVADVVICSYVLHLLTRETRAAVLAESRRLLRPGPAARLVVITVWADRRRLGGRTVHWGLQTLARAKPSAWGGLAPLDPTDDLLAAGFLPARRLVLPRRGYPSLILRAHRSNSDDAPGAAPPAAHWS